MELRLFHLVLCKEPTINQTHRHLNDHTSGICITQSLVRKTAPEIESGCPTQETAATFSMDRWAGPSEKVFWDARATCHYHAAAVFRML